MSAFTTIAQEGKLSLGLVFPLESYSGSVPEMQGQEQFTKRAPKTPMLVTGHSGQSLSWIAEQADGWLYYPRNTYMLQLIMQDWRAELEKAQQSWKPFMQYLYVDLLEDPKAPPSPIHLGFKTGSEYLNFYLKQLEQEGVNHVIINLKYGSRPAAEVIEELGEQTVPHFG